VSRVEGYCGSLAPFVVTITAKEVLMVFYSDATQGGQGFNVTTSMQTTAGMYYISSLCSHCCLHYEGYLCYFTSVIKNSGMPKVNDEQFFRYVCVCFFLSVD